MARQLRIEYEGAFYHVTSRVNRKERIFCDDKDREEFKSMLKRTNGLSVKTGTAFCRYIFSLSSFPCKRESRGNGSGFLLSQE